MAREISPKRSEALKIWLKSDRKMALKEIAELLDVRDSQIRKWKHVDKWDEIPARKGRRGAPQRNNNAKGNRGGKGGPIGNEKAVKHGLFRRWLPDDEELREIYDCIPEMNTLELLYEQIRISWLNIIRAQRIQYVASKDEMIKEIKKQKFEVVNTGTKKEPNFESMVTEEEWNFQFAWDRQATSLSSQSAAMSALTRMIKQYEAMLRETSPEFVKEEQRLRIEKLKSEIKRDPKDLSLAEAEALINQYKDDSK